MCADVDKEKMNEHWKEKTKKLFTDFANEHLGGGPYPEKEPVCYGSGDGSSYCAFCQYRSGC